MLLTFVVSLVSQVIISGSYPISPQLQVLFHISLEKEEDFVGP